MWNIMAAAKLDHSRVLVTKIRQNRSRCMVEVPVRHTHRQTDRQTDRQTNSAENKGPSGLQSAIDRITVAIPRYAL